MKYFVIEIATGDSKVAGKGIYEYDTEIEAVGTFHQKLSTAMKSELYATELVQVIRADGMPIKSEYFVRPVDEE